MTLTPVIPSPSSLHMHIEDASVIRRKHLKIVSPLKTVLIELM